MQGCLKVGYIVLAIAGSVVFGKPSSEVMAMLKDAPRPVDLLFVPSPDAQVHFEKVPESLVLNTVEGHMIVSSLQVDQASDPNQKFGPGSVLLRVSKTPVSGNMTAKDVMVLLGQEVPCKVAYRDMDSFMHLIHLRDGLESLADVHLTNTSHS